MSDITSNETLPALRYRLPKSRAKAFSEALAIAERLPGLSEGDGCYWVEFPEERCPGAEFRSLERLAQKWKGSGYYLGDDSVAPEIWWREAWKRSRKHIVFTVLDVETTGLSKESGIVEIALKQIKNGEVMATYETLVNPGMPIPLETSCIHGIIDDDVVRAPRFKDIAGDLIRLLEGTCLVAHNWKFDSRMLQQDFERQGYVMPDVAFLCTMEACKVLYPDRRRRLSDLAKFLKIEQGGAHESGADVDTTAALLYHVLEKGQNFEGDILDEWPTHSFPIGGPTLKRTNTLKTRPIERPNRSSQNQEVPPPVPTRSLTPAEQAAQEEANRAATKSCLSWSVFGCATCLALVVIFFLAIMK